MVKKASTKTANRFPFTKTALNELQTPASGRAYYFDMNCRGLQLCITSNGVRAFYFYGRISRRPARVRLGPWPELSIEDARKQAKLVVGDNAKGVDVVAKRRQAKHETTLGDAWEHWKLVKKNKRSLSIDQRVWDRDLVQWKHWSLSRISRSDVIRLHNKLGTDFGPCAGNRMLAIIRALFNRAIDDLAWKGTNPCARIPRHPEQSRERFIQPDEMPALLKAIGEETDETNRDFIMLLLLTGQRKGVVMRMRWQDVDLTNGVWHIPAEWQKNGKPLTVPLDPSVVAIVQRRLATRGDTPWVLPSPQDHKQPLRQPRHLWDRIRERAKLPDIRPHDLRRTFGSYLAMSGISLQVIGAALGHRSLASTQVYSRLMPQSVRDGTAVGVEAMRKVSGGLLPAPTPPAKPKHTRKQKVKGAK